MPFKVTGAEVSLIRLVPPVIPLCKIAPSLTVTPDTEPNAPSKLKLVVPPLVVKVPLKVLTPDNVNIPAAPSLVKFLLAPEIMEPMVIPPAPAALTTLFVALPNTTPISPVPPPLS